MKTLQQKMRIILALSSLAVTVLVIAFVRFVVSGDYPNMTFFSLLLGGMSVACISVVMLVGDIFDREGNLRVGDVLGIFILVLALLQFCLGFLLFANQQLAAVKEPITEGYALFAELQDKTASNSVQGFGDQDIDAFLRESSGDLYSDLSILDADGTALYSSDPALIGADPSYDKLEIYEFPFSDGVLLAHLNTGHRQGALLSLLADLLTIFATSLFFSIEIVLLAVKLVQARFVERNKPREEQVFSPLFFLRQITFLFYFCSSLASSFVSVLARQLSLAFDPASAELLSALPQSAELLFNCFAILLTARLVLHKGWKLPFGGGLLIIAAGILLSAFAGSISLFIASRAVVGLGYGFCWMCLRNIVLYGRTDAQKIQGFSQLNAGLYAGISTGAAVGGIIADMFSYRVVFLIAAAGTAMIIAVVLGMRNMSLEKYRAQILAERSGDRRLQERRENADPHYEGPERRSGERRRGERRHVEQQLHLPLAAKRTAGLQFLGYFLLLIVPACIVGSFISYYMPINMTEALGRSTADIGRARLLYGLLIIYFGPPLSSFLGRFRSLFWGGVLYNLSFSLILLVFGLLGGGYASLLGAVFLLGFSDSYGFVAHNSYFLQMPFAKNLGESRALSLISLLKKLAEMLGPLAFGLAMGWGMTAGLIVLGGLFLLCTLIYVVTAKMMKVSV